MIRKSVGAMIVLLVIGATLMYARDAAALCPNECELFWPAVQTYTDNTAIDPIDKPLKYTVEWDGAVIGTTVNLSIPVPKPYGHDVAHTARVKAATARGTEGEYSDPFGWNSPKGFPAKADPRGFGVR